jgi:ABC-type transport system involved in cytochrome c biogenesis permease component
MAYTYPRNFDDEYSLDLQYLAQTPLMVWLPVVERELRVAARRRATYRVRVLALLAVGAVFAWTVINLAKTTGATSLDSGQELFATLAVPAAIFSILVGVFAMSDSISMEKREGTLGLLFLTDLNGHDVIWGKLVASSLNGFYALIAVLPVLGLPILAGGVTMGQFVMLTLALISIVVLSMTTGILVSTHYQDERQSAFMTLILLGSISFFPLGPTTSIYATIHPGRMSPDVYWESIAAIWVAILLALRIASGKVPRSWQEKEPVVDSPPAVTPHWSAPPRPQIDSEPFKWLALRGEPKQGMVWIFVIAMAAIWAFGFLGDRGSNIMLDNQVVTPTLAMVNTFLKVWIAAEASRRFVEDRRNNAFELLLSTPLDERQIIRGQWLALWAQFGLPLLMLGLLEMMLQPFGAISLLCDSIALGWAGIWSGMVSKGRIRAILLSTILVLTVPWGLAYLWTTLGYGPHAIFESDKGFIRHMASTKFIVGLAADALVIVLTRKYLRKNFRRLVTERPSRLAD